MHSWREEARGSVWSAALLMLAACMGCTGEVVPPQGLHTGRADIQITLPQRLAREDVRRVQVEVRASDIIPSLTAELVQVAGEWKGSVDGIPAGTGRVIEASAFDVAGAKLYQGSVASVTVGAGATVNLFLRLQQVDAPGPYENEAPVLDSVVASSTTVLPGKSLSLAATAHDPNGDALSYAWTATAGAFSASSMASTLWTAPGTQGVQQLRLEVTDSRGTSTSVTFEVSVQEDGSTGALQVTAGFNTWPRVSALKATPAVLAVGQSVQLSAVAVDADGDSLTYGWVSDCAGSFDASTASTTGFSLEGVSTSGRCTFRVTVRDEKGGWNKGSLVLSLGSVPRVNVAPRIDSVSQSATVADGGQVVTVGLVAQDPEGKPITFTWNAGAGSILATRWTGGSGEVDWQVPVCFESPVSLTATVKDAEGASVQHVFSVAPSASAKCGLLAVSGVRKLHRVQNDGSVVVKLDDLSALPIGAWVPNAEGTGYDYREGTGRNNGTFVIPGVVRTPYLLDYGGSYYWMSSRTLDMSSYQPGRPDAVEASSDTLFSVALSGLSPWQLDQDDVQLHSMGAGMGYASLRTCDPAFEEPAEGSSSLFRDMDYTTFMSYCGNMPAWRIEPSLGDVVHATQQVYRSGTDSGLPTALDIHEVRRGAPLSVMSGAGSIALSGTLSPLPTRQQQIDLQASLFESVLLSAHPSAQVRYDYVNIGTLTRFEDFGVYAGYPDLAMAYNHHPGQGNPLVTLEYGNPFPSEWSRSLTAGASILVPFSVPQADGTPSRTAYYAVSALTQEVLEEGGVQIATARVGPPREPRLNGMDASGSVSNTGTMPLLSWSAPSLGVANRYQVRLYEILATISGGTSRVLVGTFHTSQTQLRLPFGMLVSGKRYFVQLTAYDIPALRPEAPFLMGPDYRSAARFSGVFQP